jgi:hypothetical protein
VVFRSEYLSSTARIEFHDGQVEPGSPQSQQHTLDHLGGVELQTWTRRRFGNKHRIRLPNHDFDLDDRFPGLLDAVLAAAVADAVGAQVSLADDTSIVS